MIQYNPNSNGFYFEVNHELAPFEKCIAQLEKEEPDLIYKENGKVYVETSAVLDIILEAMESHTMSYPEGFSTLGLLSQQYKSARREATKHLHIIYKKSDTVEMA